MYNEDELLALSGIQHIAFCERQWALIHIERQWADNLRTVEGQHLHNKVNNPFIFETRGNEVIARSVSIVSYRLGLYGIADIVEFEKTENKENAIKIPHKNGYYIPYPVEYKRGKEKIDDRDEVQLCAQAICLEEMFNIKINKAYIYYGETRHRTEVVLNDNLRDRVEELSQKMHDLFKKGITPKAEKKKGCKLCSLIDICMPNLNEKKLKVSEYIQRAID
ncbi:CRISPR-associated exonuclease, Cas4 family [Caloramator quimbayensis]|uniref:CRISPR-associated exonuclease Cas4 n=1 Tax=Caloramator quimbayensis TaxID=1147123 RepID=A0A1T4WNQ0_9CLOT|nr:CRISPR-associated protein Cas4 [Caloramator quimbayensis]SKA78261.1 CRISPR-associated exonuclease, Cas4 family [Caloramator quimbayensis]